jgi:hypothetical protein
MFEYLLPLCGFSVGEGSSTNVGLHKVVVENKINDSDKDFFKVYLTRSVIKPFSIVKHIQETIV